MRCRDTQGDEEGGGRGAIMNSRSRLVLRVRTYRVSILLAAQARLPDIDVRKPAVYALERRRQRHLHKLYMLVTFGMKNMHLWHYTRYANKELDYRYNGSRSAAFRSHTTVEIIACIRLPSF